MYEGTPQARGSCDVERGKKSVALVVDLAVTDAVLTGIVTATGGAAENEDEGQTGPEEPCARIHAVRCTPALGPVPRPVSSGAG